MIDTHAHLNFPEYSQRIDQVIDNCGQAGLTGVIIASSNLGDSQQAVDLAKKHRGFLFASVGIHPHGLSKKSEFLISKQIQMLQTIIEENRGNIVAVGETGLDDSDPPPPEIKRSLEDQKKLFLGQLELAAKYDLPVIVHARGLVDEAINVILNLFQDQSDPGLRGGVFHCYAGGKKRINKILSLPGEWYFGIDGNITYDQGLQNVVGQIPRHRLVLETDSPYLTPHPYRDKINSPAYLPLIAQQVAKIWNTSVEEVSETTLQNTKNLFNL